MGKEVMFDYSKAAGFVSAEEMANFKTTVMSAKETLLEKTGAGNDFLGWIDLPVDYDKDEFARIKKAAEKIQNDSDVLLVVGIGGSYLGARAAIEFLSHSFYNVLPKSVRKTPEIYFVGNSISSKYIHDLKQVLARISPSTSFPSQALPQNLQSHSVYLRKCSLKNMARKKPTSASTQPLTRLKAPLRTWQTKKDMRNSLCRMTWADVSPY